MLHVSKQMYAIFVTNKGFWRVMTRPGGRVRRVRKCRGPGRINSGSAGNVTGWVGRVNKFSIFAGRVGSDQDLFKSDGSGRVKRFSNITGRVESGHDVFKMSRVGSDHDPSDTRHSNVGSL